MDLRLYRLAFLPVAVALVVLMFFLADRPGSLTSTFPPDAFDGRRAQGTLDDLVRGYPDRNPGSRGDAEAAGYVRERLVQIGYDTSVDEFTGDAGKGSVRMANVQGVLRGLGDGRIVVVAHRDSAAPPGAGSSGTGTATMLELAAALQKTRHRKTIAMLSTDGGSAGNAGIRHFIERVEQRQPEDGGPVDAVVVLDDVGRRSPTMPFTVAWATGSRSGSLQLDRTARTAVRGEVGRDPGEPSPVAQFVRLALPVALQEQGPLIERGIDAVTLTSGGELAPRGPADGLGAVSAATLEGFGRAALGTILAVDRRDVLEHGPDTYLVVRRKVVPGWTVRLLALTLLLPLLVAAVDAAALARRRRLPLGGWLRWALAAALPFAAVLPVAYLFAGVGFLPDVPGAPFDPAAAPFDLRSALALAALGLLWALVWMLVRGAVARGAPEQQPAGPGPAAAIALLLALELLVAWLANPYAALVLVPAAHLWFLAVLPETGRRLVVLVPLLAGGLLLPAAVLAYYAIALDTGPGVLFYAALLVAGRAMGVLEALLLCVLAGTFVSVVAICRAKRRATPDTLDVTIRGPLGYAGPGSLGGTDSALGR